MHTTVVLASATYSLVNGKRATVDLLLSSEGRSVLAKVSAKSTLRGTITATVKGGSTATTSVVVS
jgi:hypothetical protein